MTGLALADLGPAFCQCRPTDGPDFHRVRESFGRAGVAVSPWWAEVTAEPTPAWPFLLGSYRHQITLRALIQNAARCRWTSVLALEQDAILVRGASQILAAADVPDDWELLYLGAYHLWSEPELVAPGCLRLHGSTGCHAVAIRSTVFDQITSAPILTTSDQQLADLIHPRGKSYCVWPAACVQRLGISTITGQVGGFPELFTYQSQTDFHQKNPTWSG